MAADVKLHDNKFSKDKITKKRRKNIKFKSTDGCTYTVDCGEQNPNISKDFPFTIPGDNKSHKLKIKGKAIKQDYTCSIISQKCNEEKSKSETKTMKVMSAVMPTMIIKVE